MSRQNPLSGMTKGGSCAETVAESDGDCRAPAPETFSASDSGPRPDGLLAEVQTALSRTPKRLPSKLFYDEKGSKLFDCICDLPEYYLTRAEMAILERHAEDLAGRIGDDCMLVEFGAGSVRKSRILLEHLRGSVLYVPVDISRDFLLSKAEELSRDHPRVSVKPVVADYFRPFKLPAPPKPAGRIAGMFLGSTIGNYEQPEAVSFLKNVKHLIGRHGRLLLGADLRKDRETLEAAYNDDAGVTEQFNLNILSVVNRRLGADFDPRRFVHVARYEELASRVEMRLVSVDDQKVAVGDRAFHFKAGEAIVTEHSYKYAIEDVKRLAALASLEVERVWTDSADLFSLHLLRAAA